MPTISTLCALIPLSSSLAGGCRDTGANLCSQPTLSRLENAPSLKDAIRLTWALVDQWMASYEREPASVILDIDDTCDVVHGHQQLSLFNAHYDERCFLPIHVYDTERSRPVAVVLRSGKTPSGVEVRAHLRRLVRRIRQRSTGRASPSGATATYARPEAMEWCEANRIDYVFGLPGSKPLAKKIDEAADAVRTERALSNKPVVRGYAETRHKAKSWSRERRAVARIEATPLGLDTRFVVTNVEYGAAEWITPPSVHGARTSSSCTRRSSLPIERPVVPRSQIRSASRCTRRLTGSCSPFATPSRNRAI